MVRAVEPCALGVRIVVVYPSSTGAIIRAMTTLIFVLGLAAVQAAAPSKKVDIVSVTGCLKEASPDNWTLVNATDPVPSTANAPPAKDVAAIPPAGRNTFKLIGVSEFNLPAHRDQTVVIKGLFIKAAPLGRLNMTSVTIAAPSCAQPGK